MALHFPLMVNDEWIGTFVARRREVVIPPDRVCTYDIEVRHGGATRTAAVRHDYDAGAFSLIQAALAATEQGLPAGVHCASCDGHSCPDVG